MAQIYEYDVPGTTYFEQISSANTTTTATSTPPAGVHAFFIQVGTTSGYMTLDGSTPSSSNGLLITKDQLPWFCPVTAVIKIRSSGATASVASIQWLR